MSPDVKEFYGKDVASAIKEACETLNVAQENLDIEVLETGSNGIFGLIRKKAHIRVSIQPDDEVEEVVPPKKRAAKAKAKKKGGAKQAAGSPQISEQPPENNSAAEKELVSAEPSEPDTGQEAVELSKENREIIASELDTILTLMSCPSEISIEFLENTVHCKVTGEFEDDLTGQDGRTIDSLQYILRKIISRKISDRIRLTIDVGDYRERRNQELMDLAVDYAALVKQNGKTQVIPSLNPSERRVVHVALQDDSEIRSRSVGEGLFKKVLIYKPGKGKKHNGRKKNRNRNRKKNDTGQNRDA